MTVEIDPALDGEVGSTTTIELDGTDYRIKVFWLAEETNTPWHGSDPGNILAAVVNDGGSFVGADGVYSASQASTSGGGSGATFSVTLTAGEIGGPVTVVDRGSGYETLDSIVLDVVGVTENTAADILVTLPAATPGVWIASLFQADGTPLVQGQVLRHGVDILAGMTSIPGVPQGRIIAWDFSGNSRDPGRDDLVPGSDVRLVYRTAEEVGRA